MQNYLGMAGILVVNFIQMIVKSVEYSNKPSKQSINKISQDEITKTVYDNLKIPERKRIKLRNRILKMQEKRKRKHLQHDPEDSENDLIEEPITLKDFALDPSSPVKFTIQGEAESVPVTWEIDTGSPISLICKTTWDKIPHKDMIQKLEDPHSFTDFNGAKVRILAKYNLNHKIGEFIHFNHPTYVVDHPDPTRQHTLLGADLYRAKRLGIDSETGSTKAWLSFPKGKQRKRIEFQQKQDFYATNTIEISAGETKNIEVSLIDNINKIEIDDPRKVINTHGTATCTSIKGYQPKISLCTLDNQGRFNIPFTNKEYGNLTIFEGEKLGEFQALKTNTTLQSTENIIQRIGQDSKPLKDKAEEVLSLRRTLYTKKPPIEITTPFLYQPDKELPVFLISKDGKTMPQNKIYPKIHQINANFTNEKRKLFWEDIFNQLFEKFPTITEVTLDMSNFDPTLCNYVQLIFPAQDNSRKLTILHKDLSINKIKLVNDTESESEMSEEDLSEELFYQKKIQESKSTWENLLKYVPKEYQKWVFYLLTQKHKHVISKHGTDFGSVTLPGSQFKIELENEQAFSCRPYPLNEVYKEFVDETIQDMVKAGLLIQEASQFGTGVFVRARPSADGNHRIRLIYDLRKLNSVTKRSYHPIPSIKSLLQKLNKKNYWCLVDLKDSYQSILLDPATRHVASIVCASGQFTPTRMGYGFCNAPSHFSKVIAQVIANLPGIFNYLDGKQT